MIIFCLSFLNLLLILIVIVNLIPILYSPWRYLKKKINTLLFFFFMFNLHVLSLLLAFTQSQNQTHTKFFFNLSKSIIKFIKAATKF